MDEMPFTSHFITSEKEV